jgi:hypothetical protein
MDRAVRQNSNRRCFYLNKRDPKGLVDLITISRIPTKRVDKYLGYNHSELATYIRGVRRISPEKYLAYIDAFRTIMRKIVNKSELTPLPPGPRYICDACKKGTYRRQGQPGRMLCESCYGKQTPNLKYISKKAGKC